MAAPVDPSHMDSTDVDAILPRDLRLSADHLISQTKRKPTTTQIKLRPSLGPPIIALNHHHQTQLPDVETFENVNRTIPMSILLVF